MSRLFKEIVDQNLAREERILISERRAKDKLSNNFDKQANDLKIDVNLALNQSEQRKSFNTTEKVSCSQK